jgi:arylsulfatase A-like enzyme/Tfp pilus assembly protein PilF
MEILADAHSLLTKLNDCGYFEFSGLAIMKRRFPAIIRLAILAAVLVFQPGCRRGPQIPRLKQNKTTNLLLITVDSLRPDRLGSFGSAGARTPNLDRLAEKGVAFRNCYAPTPLSLPSHCTVFTGREPLAHRVHTDGREELPASEQTWAEVMKSHDFETYALVSSYKLHSKFGLKQGFDTFDDSLDYGQIINTLNTSIAADKVFLRFRAWLEQRSGPRFFAWVNFSDPQAPYQPLPEYARLSENDPYGGEVTQVDHFVGEMLNLLEAKKLAEKTVVVLAGSHGEALGEHGEVGHGIFGYEEALKVPLIIHNPAVFPKKQAVDRRVRLLDLLPSLLELFEMEAPVGVQGQSFWPLLSPPQEKAETERPVYFESWYGHEEMGLAPLSGFLNSHYKFISLPEAELYNLRTDPGEKDNLVIKESVLAAKMSGLLQAYKDSWAEEKKEGQGLDPKKGIEAVKRLRKAEDLIASEKLEEAEKELGNIIREYKDRKLPRAYDDLTFVCWRKKDSGKMEETLRQAAAGYPNLSRFGIALAQSLSNSGRLSEAEKICLDMLARNPQVSQAHILLGKICQKKGEPREALSRLEKALNLEPLNYSLQVEYASQLAELGQKARSLEILEKLLKNPSLAADPASAPLRADMAGILIKVGEGEMANTLLLDIVSTGQGDSKIWSQVGLGYLDRGNLPKAKESLEKALSLDPNNALALSGLGTFYLTLFRAEKQKTDLDSATAYYTRAKEVSPRLVAAWNGLGVAWRYAGDREKAIAHWKQALLIDPGFTNTYFNLGITLLESGRRQEAYRTLNVCLEKYAGKLSDGEKRQLEALIQEARQ